MKRNVALIADSNQFIYAITNSYMIQNQAEKKLFINIILFNLSKDEIEIAKKIITKMKIPNVNLIFHDEREFALGVSKLKHVTNITNARLYLSSMLYEVDKVLYLDNDIVVDGDLNELFDHLEDGDFFGRPWNKKHKWVLRLKRKSLLKNKWYVNAGVIFLNLDYIRNNNIEEQFRNFLINKNEEIKYADQDVLNCNLEFKPMPYVWNIARDTWIESEPEISKITNLKIYHFLSTEKQWGVPVDEITERATMGSLTLNELKKMIEPQLKWKEYYKEIVKNNF